MKSLRLQELKNGGRERGASGVGGCVDFTQLQFTADGQGEEGDMWERPKGGTSKATH